MRRIILFTIICIIFSSVSLAGEFYENDSMLSAKINNICYVYSFVYGLCNRYPNYEYEVVWNNYKKIYEANLARSGIRYTPYQLQAAEKALSIACYLGWRDAKERKGDRSQLLYNTCIKEYYRKFIFNK